LAFFFQSLNNVEAILSSVGHIKTGRGSDFIVCHVLLSFYGS
jgi:hypothetical protein